MFKSSHEHESAKSETAFSVSPTQEKWLGQLREVSWSEIAPLVDQLNTFAQQWEVIATKDLALAEVISHQYHRILAQLLEQVQTRIGDFAFHFRGSNARKEPGFEAYNQEAIARHCALLGWLIQQPEWEDHRHGLDVDSELPEEYYQKFVPAYLSHNWKTGPQKAHPRRIDTEVLAKNWEVPTPPQTTALR